MTIHGAKKGSSKQRQPVIAPDSAQSKTYIKILYGLGEGEIAGLADGYKSVYLDDTPLQNDDGEFNFAGVKVDFRTGTNDQTYIDGFPDVASETNVGVELKHGTPFVKAFNNLDLDALRVRIKWGALRQQNPDNGDVGGVKIDYAIDVKTDNGGWVQALNTSINAKTSNAYERSHRIDLPKAGTGWAVRVRRITPNSTSELVSDKMFVSAITEVIDLKLRYPNTALLGLRYDAMNFSNVAKMAARCRGLIIKVPTNYNPITRNYDGLWDGQFKLAYTNNPAWVYYDLCTAERYGLGSRLTQSMIDKWSLYRLAQYCDQMVDDGMGGQEPRFTVNVYIQSADGAFELLSRLAGVFRAISYWDGTSIVLDADIPQDSIYSFSRANVIDGVFEYTGTRARDRHTVAKVAWDNPANHFKTEYEYVRDEKAIAKFGVRVADIQAWGCTSKGQAQRAGLWALKSEQLETRMVTFKVGLDGYIPAPAKVIEISDELFAGRATGGRHEFTITAVQYNPVKYDAIDTGAVASERPISVINPTVQAPTKSVNLSSYHTVNQGVAVTTLVIGWEQVTGAVKYTVDWRKDNGNWQALPPTGTNSIEITGVYAGQYEARVTAISAFGQASLATHSNLTQIQGKQAKPPRPINLSVQGVLFGMNLGWNFAKGSGDTNYTEIEVSPDGRTHITTLGTFAYPTNKHEITGLQGNFTQFYRARIVDKLGNTSDWTDWAFGTTSADAEKVLDILSGQISQSHLDQSLRTPIAKIGTIESKISGINSKIPAIESNINSFKSKIPSINKIPTIESAVNSVNGNLSTLNSQLATAQNELSTAKSTLQTAVGNITTERNRITAAIRDITALQADKNAKTQEIANLTQTVGSHTSSIRELGVTTGDLSQKYSQLKTTSDTANSEISAIKQTQNGQAMSVERLNARFEHANLFKASNATNGHFLDEKNRGQLTAWDSHRASDFISVKTNTVYEIKAYNGDFSNLRVIWLDENKTFIKGKIIARNGDYATFNSENASFVRISSYWRRTEKDVWVMQVAGLASDAMAEIETLNRTITDTNGALSERIDSLTADYNGNKASVQSSINTLTDTNRTQAERLDRLDSEIYSPNLLRDGDTPKTSSNWNIDFPITESLQAGRRVYISLNGASGLTSVAVYNSSVSGAAKIGDLTNENGVWRGEFDWVSFGDNNELRFYREPRSSAQTVTASLTTTNGSKIANLERTLTTNNQSLSERIGTVESSVSGNTSSINTLSQSLTTKERALSEQINTAKSELGGRITQISNETRTLSNANRTIGEQINTVKSELGGRITQISNETRTLSNANRTIGERIDRLDSELGGADSVSDNLLINSNRTLVTGAYLIATYRISETLANGDKVRLTVTAPQLGINRTGFMAYNSNSAGGSKLADISESQGSVYTAEFEWNVGTGDNNEVWLYHDASSTRSISTIASVSLQKITTGSGLASIKSSVANLERTLTTNNQSLSERINTVQTTVNSQTASIQQHAQSLNGLSAQWTLKVQSGGVVSGIGLASNNGVSDFAVRADKFYITNPTGGNKSPMFTVTTRPTTLNGTTVPAGVYLSDAYIQNASITMAKIADSIQSDNYVAGRQGWRLFKDGRFELNNTFGDGSSLELNSKGLTVWYDKAQGKKAVELGILL